jgi:hypothetical protein
MLVYADNRGQKAFDSALASDLIAAPYILSLSNF